MNYSGQAPNGPPTMADQVAFLQQNAGTRLMARQDRLRDKLAPALANYRRTDTREETRGIVALPSITRASASVPPTTIE